MYERLATHRAFVCKRIGGVPTGWVPNATEYRELDASGLTLLNALCRASTLEEVWAEWANGVAQLLGMRSEQDLEAVARALSSYGYLVENAAGRPALELDARSLPDAIDDDDTPSQHEVQPSFVLRATTRGLAAWSVTAQRYFTLTDEAVAYLVEWIADCPTEEHATAARENWRRRFCSAGILVARTGHQRSSAMISPVRLEGLLAALTVGAKRDVRRVDASQTSVAIRSPGARTPIYLCCCIDSAAHAGWMPLALGMLAARIKQNRELENHFEIVPDFLYSSERAIESVAKFGAGIVLMSDYEWTIREHLHLGERLRELCPDMLFVHGGPSAPKYESACTELMTRNPHADIVVRGEGEVTIIEILRALSNRAAGDRSLSCLESVTGLTFRGDAIIRTQDRERSMDINEFPSPYLSGVFDNCPTHLHGAATIETNRGCPYGCTFCDWGSATLQKIRQFDIERVRQEIEWVGRAGIPILWCADANFGILERDVEIARMVASTFARYGAPKEMVVNYAKNATSRVATIVEILTRAGIAAPAMISIQTTDPEVLQIIRRSNIKTKNYDALLTSFRKERLEVSTDLLIGLPGATVESFKRDLQYYFEREVPIKAYVLTVLPNSPMADPAYMEQYRITKDPDGFVRSTFSYTNADLKLMAQLYHAYSMLVLYGLFKYALMFLQWEHRIRAVDFVHALVRRIRRDPDSLPTVSWVMQCFSGFRSSCGGWRTFATELAELAREELAVPIDGAFRSVLEVQAAVLTDHGRVLPCELATEHDVVSYFAAQRASNGQGPSLSSYPRGVLTVTDPNGLCHLDPERHVQYDRHARAWELESPLKLAASSLHFMELEQAKVAPGSTIFSHDSRPFSFDDPA